MPSTDSSSMPVLILSGPVAVVALHRILSLPLSTPIAPIHDDAQELPYREATVVPRGETPQPMRLRPGERFA